MWHIDAFISELEHHGLKPRTIGNYRLHLERFTSWCSKNGIDSPRSITCPDVFRYIETEILLRDITPGWKYSATLAVNRYLAALEQQHELFVAPFIPARKPEVSSGKYRAIEREELGSILDSFPTDSGPDVLVKSMLETGYSAALRPCEIRHLEVEDIDFADGRLFIRQSKGDKDRIVPIGATALLWLKRYITEVRPQYLSDASDRHVYLAIRSRTRFRHRNIAEFVRYRLEKHGYPRISLHQLRASAATHMVESGMDISYVQRILGHTELRTTQVYVQIDQRSLAAKLATDHPRIHFDTRSQKP
jgi:integrase/recombinase XerD